MTSVKQPSDGSIRLDGGGELRLGWEFHVSDKWAGKFKEAQYYVDSEILRRCEPYTPKLTGKLIESGRTATVLGSGLVQWDAKYAKAQYYMTRVNPSQTGPLRYNFWFERMKEAWLTTIIRGVQQVMKGNNG